jgi:hypothetical protein
LHGLAQQVVGHLLSLTQDGRRLLVDVSAARLVAQSIDLALQRGDLPVAALELVRQQVEIVADLVLVQSTHAAREGCPSYVVR